MTDRAIMPTKVARRGATNMEYLRLALVVVVGISAATYAFIFAIEVAVDLKANKHLGPTGLQGALPAERGLLLLEPLGGRGLRRIVCGARNRFDTQN